VAGRRVLALRPLDEPSRDRRRPRLRRAAFERLDIAQTERFEGRQVEPSDGVRDVRKCVRPFVPELRRIRQLTRADGVQDDHAGPRHIPRRYPSSVANALGLFGILVFIVAIAFSAGVTWVVVRVSPNPNKKRES
jgi:hypothetical protein